MLRNGLLKKVIIANSSIILATNILVAGGKVIVPAYTEVIPIPPPKQISPVPVYIGVGAVASSISRDSCSCDPTGADLKDLRYGGIVRLGYDFNNYFGIEARALKTFGSNVFSEVSHYGIYAKPQYHVADAANVYALLGYGQTTVDYTNGVLSSHNPKSGFSYGAGFEYDFNGEDAEEGAEEGYSRTFDGQGDQEEGWGIWADIQNLLTDEGLMHTNSNIVTAGITYDF